MTYDLIHWWRVAVDLWGMISHLNTGKEGAHCGGLFSWVKGNHGSFPVFHTFRKKCSPKDLRRIVKITSQKPCLIGAHLFQDSFSISIKMAFGKCTPSLFDVFFFLRGWVNKTIPRLCLKPGGSSPVARSKNGLLILGLVKQHEGALQFHSKRCQVNLTSDDSDTKNPVVRKKKEMYLTQQKKQLVAMYFFKGFPS